MEQSVECSNITMGAFSQQGEDISKSIDKEIGKERSETKRQPASLCTLIYVSFSCIVVLEVGGRG